MPAPSSRPRNLLGSRFFFSVSRPRVAQCQLGPRTLPYLLIIIRVGAATTLRVGYKSFAGAIIVFFVATVIVLHGLTVDVIWPLTTARGGNCSKSRPGNWERSPGPGESPRVLANGSGKKSAAISLDIAISEHICCVQCAQTFFS